LSSIDAAVSLFPLQVPIIQIMLGQLGIVNSILCLHARAPNHFGLYGTLADTCVTFAVADAHHPDHVPQVL
jgi:hypothetical protein